MRRLFLIAGIVAMAFVVVGCSNSKNKNGEAVTEETVTYDMLNLSDYVELGTYKGLILEDANAEIPESDLITQVEYRIMTYKEYEEVEDRDTVEAGDYVNIDCTARIDGAVNEDYSGTDLHVSVDSGLYGLGDDYAFEEELAVIKPGESTTVDFTFPKDYQDTAVAGKDCTLEINLKAIERLVMPSLTDDYIKKYTGYDSLNEYKEAVRAVLETTAKDEANMENLLEKIIENSTIKKDFPQKVIDDEIERLKEESESYALSSGMEVEEYIEEASGMTLEESAKESLKRLAVWDLLVKAEGVEVTEEDIEAEIQDMMNQSGYTRGDILTYFGENGLDTTAEYHKMQKKLLNNNTFTKKKSS